MNTNIWKVVLVTSVEMNVAVIVSAAQCTLTLTTLPTARSASFVGIPSPHESDDEREKNGPGSGYNIQLSPVGSERPFMSDAFNQSFHHLRQSSLPARPNIPPRPERPDSLRLPRIMIGNFSNLSQPEFPTHKYHGSA
jgi:hypothetical protein